MTGGQALNGRPDPCQGVDALAFNSMTLTCYNKFSCFLSRVDNYLHTRGAGIVGLFGYNRIRVYGQDMCVTGGNRDAEQS